MKTTFLTVLVILAVYLVAYAAEENFVYPVRSNPPKVDAMPKEGTSNGVYDSKGNRDPFVPLVTKEGIYIGDWRTRDLAEELVLEGIVWDPQGESLAIVSGTVVKEGDIFLNLKVLEIRKEGIRLLKGDEELVINLIEEE